MTHLETKIVRALSRQSRLLLVDDNRFDLEWLRVHWNEVGVLTSEARDGYEALRLAADPTMAFDGAIVDLRMPGMPGIDVILELRQQMRVAAITGSPGPWIDEALHKCPVLTLFEKPFTAEHCMELARLFELRIITPRGRENTGCSDQGRSGDATQGGRTTCGS